MTRFKVFRVLLFIAFSKLYENAMKGIVLTDHINTISGKNLKDKLD